MFLRSLIGTATPPMWSRGRGEHDGDDVVEAVPDRAEVGRITLMPGWLSSEQHATVDDQELALVFEHGHVAADLAESASG